MHFGLCVCGYCAKLVGGLHLALGFYAFFVAAVGNRVELRVVRVVRVVAFRVRVVLPVVRVVRAVEFVASMSHMLSFPVRVACLVQRVKRRLAALYLLAPFRRRASPHVW